MASRGRDVDWITARLSSCSVAVDPRDRLLANVDGPVSEELLEVLREPGQNASVLVGLVDRPGGLSVLFTERAAHLPHHPGQISFPGGRIEPGETVIEAALREAAEEVGLEPSHVTVAGCLDAHLTSSGFLVTPVVGFVDRAFEAVPNADEVASVFEVPLDYILDPRNVRTLHRERLGTRFRVYELEYGERRIWGATAAMLITFRDLLAGDAEHGGSRR